VNRPPPPEPSNETTAEASSIATAIGSLASTTPTPYSAHSLRSGFITEAKNRRIDEYEIMKHTRHKTVTVMRMYDGTTGRWDRNPASRMGI